MASEKINGSSSQRCPAVGSSTWGCSRHLCLGAFHPSLRSTNLLGFCLVLTELQACIHDHNSTEESFATVSPVTVSRKPTPSSLFPNMGHSPSISLGWLLQALLCMQHLRGAKLQLSLYSPLGWDAAVHLSLSSFSGRVGGSLSGLVCGSRHSLFMFASFYHKTTDFRGELCALRSRGHQDGSEGKGAYHQAR